MASEALASIREAEQQAAALIENARKAAETRVAAAKAQAAQMESDAKENARIALAGALEQTAQNSRKNAEQEMQQANADAHALQERLRTKQADAVKLVLQTLTEAQAEKG